jgi:iron complex transport system substrate-binding protein
MRTPVNMTGITERACAPLREIDDATRREFLVGIGSLLVLGATGCADGGAVGGGPSGETRRVRSGEGSVEIPADANRIVTTTHGWDAAVALGQQDRVIGVAEWRLFLDYVEYLGETRTEKMEPLEPLEGSANLERIAALDPDLTVVPYWNSKELETRSELERIAPLVELVVPGHPRPYDDWKGSLRAYGEVFGVPERAEGYVEEQEDAAATLHEDIASSPAAGEPVTLAYFIGFADGWRVDKRSNTASLVLEDLRLPRPEEPELKDGGTMLSMELTPQVDADHVWVYLSEPGAREELEGNALWRSLGAVERGTARIVPGYWNSGYALAIPRVIEDVRGYLLGMTTAAGCPRSAPEPPPEPC